MRTTLTSLALALLLCASLTAQVRISEFMAQNNLSLADPEGEWPDWVEIENAGAAAVNIGGWYLTDSAKKPTKWQFPNPTTLAAGQRMIVFASGKGDLVKGGPLHTNFKLSAGGEYLALRTPAQVVVTEFAPAYPPQFPDVSYGLGNSGYGYFASPSPGISNGWHQPILGTVTHAPALPKATDPIVVTVRHIPIPNLKPKSVDLYYRVGFNGESSIAMRDDGKGGDVLAGDDVWTATIPSGTPAGSMLRWRMVADYGGYMARRPQFKSTTNSPQYFGVMVADPSLTSALPILNWWVQSPSAARTSTGTRCVVWYEGRLFDNVHVRRRGGTSAYWPKKSYKFDFNRGYPMFYGNGAFEAEEVNANTTWGDKAFVRQPLSFDLYDLTGTKASQAFPIRMQQNGRFFSVAIFTEQVDERFLEREELDPRGALYKMFNTTTSWTSKVEKKSRHWENHDDLRTLVQGIALSGSALERFLFDHVDVPAVLDYIAGTVLMHDQDCVHKNHYLYRDTEGDGEWRFIPWDKDLTFGRHYFRSYGVLNDVIWADRDPSGHPLFGDRNHTKVSGEWNRLIDAVYRVPRIQRMYLRRLRTTMDQVLQPTTVSRISRVLEKRMDAMKAAMSKDVALDKAKWGVPRYWDRTIDFHKGLARIENLYLNPRRKHLFVKHSSSSTGIIPPKQTAGLELVFGAVEPSPASGDQDEEYIQVVNCNKVTVDISGWVLRGGVQFTFEPGTVLGPGESLYVSPDLRKFRGRSSGPRGGQSLFVVGPYSGNLSPTESIWITDGNRVATRNGGFSFRMTTKGQGDVSIAVAGARPYAELFTLISLQTSGTIGCGPLFGVGMDALFVAGFPLGSHPLHVRADSTGAYSWTSKTNVVTKGITLDACAVELDRTLQTLRSSPVRRVRF